MSETQDLFGLQTFEDSSSYDDVRKNLQLFSEKYISNEVDVAIIQIQSTNPKYGVIFGVLQTLGFNSVFGGDSKIDDCFEVIGSLDVDVERINLNKFLSSAFSTIALDSPEESVSVDHTDSVSGFRAITFKKYGVTLDRGELLKDKVFENYLERKCRTALFKIRTAVLQKQGKDNLDKIIPTA